MSMTLWSGPMLALDYAVCDLLGFVLNSPLISTVSVPPHMTVGRDHKPLEGCSRRPNSARARRRFCRAGEPQTGLLMKAQTSATTARAESGWRMAVRVMATSAS
jgi:hypothetical protein